MDTITMDGGWNEENCNIALNCFLAGHKISPNLKYQEERNQDGSFGFSLKISARRFNSVFEGKGSAKDSSPANKAQAMQACKAEVVQKLFRADLLPRYDGNNENLLSWIAESYRKYLSPKDWKARRDRLVKEEEQRIKAEAFCGMIFKQFFGQNPISRLWVEVRDGLSNMLILFYYNANDVSETCESRPNAPNDFVISHEELSSMFDVFFGLQARCFFRRLFIAGPLECVESCEVRKFFETEANRLEPPAKNGRHHFRSGNPTPNIEGQLESDVVDALNNFHHRQFIFAKFNRSPVNNRLVNYFNRKRVLMFDNANSENADRRHIKFPIVCSALETRTTLPMIQALMTKLQNFIDLHQSNHPTKRVENEIENGTLGNHRVRQDSVNENGNKSGNTSFFQKLAKQIKQESSPNGADSDIEFLEENAPCASNLRKIRNALMTVDVNANFKVESDECPPSPTSGGNSISHQRGLTTMGTNVQGLPTSTRMRATSQATCPSSSRADESLQMLSPADNYDADMIKAFIRQQIHEIPRTDQNRHKRKALRSISTEVSEFLHCWIEDDDERIDSDVMADELRSELNAFFLQQTDSKLRIYVSTMALVEQLCMGFITQRRSLRAVELQPQMSNCVANKPRNKRRTENSYEQPKVALKRVKREVFQID